MYHESRIVKEAGSLFMRALFRKLSVPAVLLLALSFTTFVNAGPRRRNPGDGGGTYSVAEPASLALLSLGLVSLGLYAKRKKDKK
jgi:hypothetical protein